MMLVNGLFNLILTMLLTNDIIKISVNKNICVFIITHKKVLL